MKQGTGNSQSGQQKREPNSHAVDICSVAEMGTQVLHTHGGSSLPLYEGRGYEAPMSGSQTHHSGSQGKHR